MKRILYFLLTIVFFTSCEKYLDKVPSKSLSTLSTIAEYQKLLDSQILYSKAPLNMELATDNFYLSYESWQASYFLERNSYVWSADIYEGSAAVQDWREPYNAIYNCNVVLDGLKDLKVLAIDQYAFNELKGHALFMRGYYHYLLQELFGQSFRPGNNDALGIPLKLSSKIDEKVSRATVKETFDLVLSDLKIAASLVSAENQYENKCRPSKASIYALLSKVSLTMQEYAQAKLYADSSLIYYNGLLNYNELYPSYNLPFPDNTEVMFAVQTYANSILIRSTTTFVDTLLYDLYDDNDLRKSVFFKLNTAENKPYFKVNYSGSNVVSFCLAVDEVYLNRAECKARLGDVNGAIDDLNTLLETRFKTDTYSPIKINEVQDVLGKVLEERRKGMIFRGNRWSDLRRLNQDPERAVILKRTLGNKEYILLPNSPRYAYPVPKEEVQWNDLVQNER